MKYRRLSKIVDAEQFKVDSENMPETVKLLGTVYQVFEQKGVPYIAVEGDNILIVNNGDYLVEDENKIFVLAEADFLNNYKRIK